MVKVFYLILIISLHLIWAPTISTELPLIIEGEWVGYPADSSFRSEIVYTLSPREKYIYAENLLFNTKDELIRTYEGMYFLRDDTIRYQLKGEGEEFHSGIAYLKDSVLTHVATILPGASVKSYRSQVVVTSKNQFSYYANYSKEATPPTDIKISNPIIYNRKIN